MDVVDNKSQWHCQRPVVTVKNAQPSPRQLGRNGHVVESAVGRVKKHTIDGARGGHCVVKLFWLRETTLVSSGNSSKFFG